jgi:hypothetical protein
MKAATKVIFASALMLSVVAPSLSHAGYFVDQRRKPDPEVQIIDATGSALARGAAIFFQSRNAFSLPSPPEQIQRANVRY